MNSDRSAANKNKYPTAAALAARAKEQWSKLTPLGRKVAEVVGVVGVLSLGLSVATTPHEEVVGSAPQKSVAHEPGVYDWHRASAQIDVAQKDAEKVINPEILSNVREKYNINEVVGGIVLNSATADPLDLIVPRVDVVNSNSWAGRLLGKPGATTFKVADVEAPGR